ncbi:hypothetical protein ACROYT_G033144, partial [Oculina patagonica]
ARQKMDAKPKLPDVKSLNIADEFWYSLRKTLDAGGTILGWLRQPKFGIISVAPSELCISYLTFSFSSYVLRYSASIFHKCSRFPYQEDTINEWFTLPTDDVQRDQALNIINVDKEGNTRKCYTSQNQTDNCFPESLEDDEFEIFFHGTKHKSAQNIIDDGINVKLGNEKQDFSDRDGFYLGKNFDEAYRWTRSRGYPNMAVLVFRVNKLELRGNNNEKGLDLRDSENLKEWQEVIRQFRNRPDRKFRKIIDKSYQFIEGPMASISGKNPRSSVSHPRQKDGSYQLCVRSVNCAGLFDRSLHSVVFFDK